MNREWPLTKLSQLILEERQQVGTYDGNGLPVLGVTNIGGVTRTGIEASADKSKYLRVRPNRLVYNPYRINVGSIGLVSSDQEGICSPAYVVFAPTETIDSRFLFFFLKSTRGNSQINFFGNRGTVRSALRFDDLCKIEIPLPCVGEQRRVVDRIQSLTQLVACVRALRNASTAESLTLHAKLMSRVFDKYRSQSVPIGSKFRVTTGGTPSRSNPAYWRGDVNWVSSGEVSFRRINQTAEKITRLGVQESNAKVYPPSTVLLAMIGQGKTRGQCAILDCSAATNQNVAAIHVHETDHIPEYVYWWLYSNYQLSRASEVGTAQPALSGDRVKKMLIPLPSPTEQLRVVREMQSLEVLITNLKQLQTDTMAEIEALLPSILDRAFSGAL